MFTTVASMLWSRKRRLLATTVAVVLGVAFLVATIVLGDTTKAGFSDTLAAANRGTDVVVRSASRVGGVDERQVGIVPAGVLGTVAALPGVTSAAPEVTGIAQILDADGDPVGGEGPPTMGGNWITDPDLAAFTLVAGRAPTPVGDGPIEVVVDEATAADADLTVGSATAVLTPARIPVVVTGIAALTDAPSMGGATYVAFDTASAQRLLLGGADGYSSVLVHAADGVGAADLQATVDAALPAAADLEAITGSELTVEMQQDVDDAFLGVFRAMLLAFAAIAVIVATFSIHNTFSILVAQRTRESALLRAIGASRRQVITAVAAEALVVGVVATGIGIAVGLVIAAGLRALMESGLDLPPAGLVVTSGAVVAAIVVGVGTTLLASIGPAVKASRVAPLAALRDVAVDRSGASKLRAGAGLVLAGLGITWMVTATAGENALGRAGVGVLCLLISFVVLGPVVARPAAAVLGTFPAATRGVTGRLARRNAMRNPRRTASSASALLVGTAVVGLFATFGASLKQSVDDTVAEHFAGDLVILPEGFSGALLSPGLPAAIADQPEVASAVGTAFGPALIDGQTVDVAGTDVAALGSVFDVELSAGSFFGFTGGDLAISEHYAVDHDLAVGSPVAMTFADGAAADLTVAAVYRDRMTFGDLLITDDEFTSHTAQASLTVVLVDLAPGVDPVVGRQAVAAVTERFGAPDPMDRAEYGESVSSQIDAMLFFVYAMLGVAVLIALLGIGNTLSLSIHDRRRELGLLRAVGQDRRQLRSAVRWESVIVAVFGTVGGVGFGVLGAWAIMRALHEQEGYGSFAVPVVPLAAVLVFAAAAGVLAAVRPARRAARTDILAAVAGD